tara:strand:+ start:32 stop:229 length:198 start_codon:yes stop_codon:yes gene_type:complete
VLKSVKDWLSRIYWPLLGPDTSENERARDQKGRYVADDPSTPDVNEAYTQKLEKIARKKKSKSKK